MTEAKRGLSPDAAGLELVAKRARGDDGAVVRVTKEGVRRTSSLLAPTMLLTGHGGEVFACAFSPDGATLASASADRAIFLWRVEGECENYASLTGHKNAVLGLAWAAGGDRLASCSPDRTVRAWDAETGAQVKKMAEHTGVVNAVAAVPGAPPLLASASDDADTKVWDLRARRSAATLPGRYPVLAVALAAGGDAVYTGGVDNVVRAWDLRRAGAGAAPALELAGHTDSVTGLAVSPAGTHVLSNSMDGTLRSWDVRPYAPAERCARVFVGHSHGFEKNLLRCAWSPDGRRVTAGSADRCVHVWDAGSGEPVYRLPGHDGCVNDVAFHPAEPVIASAGSDGALYMGELAE